MEWSATYQFTFRTLATLGAFCIRISGPAFICILVSSVYNCTSALAASLRRRCRVRRHVESQVRTQQTWCWIFVGIVEIIFVLVIVISVRQTVFIGIVFVLRLFDIGRQIIGPRSELQRSPMTHGVTQAVAYIYNQRIFIDRNHERVTSGAKVDISKSNNHSLLRYLRKMNP